MTLEYILQLQIAGNTGQEYLIALGVFVGVLIALKIFQSAILRSLGRAAAKTKTDLDDVLVNMVRTIRPPFYFIVAFYSGLKYLNLSEVFASVIDGAFIALVAYEIIKALQGFIDYGAKKLIAGSADGKEMSNKFAIKNISTILKILLWVLAVLLVLSNWGINVTSLVAGLGIGGIAIALAVQNILGDIFSSFSIFIDKPFEAGDFIVVGPDMGIVERIGIKTTRIRTLQGEELVVSNQELTSVRVRNFKKMDRRRVVFTFGVAYETPNEKLKNIPGMVKDVIVKEKLTEFDRANFKEFGDFSLNYEIVYYVGSPDYNEYMNTHERINLAIKEAFEREGIEFAYPTQTIFMKK